MWKIYDFRFSGKVIKKCVHLRYKLTADAAKSYFEDGFSVVIQNNYYDDELNRMLSYLHTYPVDVIVLCPNVEVIKERELHRGKTGYVVLQLRHYTIHL